MKKHAEFYISGIRFNKLGTQIESLRRHKAGVGREIEAEFDFVSRHAVVSDILNGINYFTAVQVTSGSFKPGSAISLYKDKFLRANENKTEKDNLGKLPTI